MMGVLTINGEPWRVTSVRGGDPHLIDRTGSERLATTDPMERTIFVNDSVQPPLLDQVLMHEIAHAITVSWDLLGPLRYMVPEVGWVAAEEWAARLVEDHAIEAVVKAQDVLGRPPCIMGTCAERTKEERHGRL